MFRPMTLEDWHDAHRHALAHWLAPRDDAAVLLLFNAEDAPVRFVLPPGAGCSCWTVRAATPQARALDGIAVEAPANGLLVLVSEPQLMLNRPPRSGVLLHPTSLPGPHGSGDFGPAAYHFVDWLVSAGQTRVADAAADADRLRQFALRRACRPSPARPCWLPSSRSSSAAGCQRRRPRT